MIYKIIFMTMSVNDPMFENNLGMIEENFETLEEAQKFMREDELRRCKNEWEDGFDEDDDREVNFEDYNDKFIIEQSYTGDLQFRCVYKIVGVK